MTDRLMDEDEFRIRTYLFGQIPDLKMLTGEYDIGFGLYINGVGLRTGSNRGRR